MNARDLLTEIVDAVVRIRTIRANVNALERLILNHVEQGSYAIKGHVVTVKYTSVFIGEPLLSPSVKPIDAFNPEAKEVPHE